MHRAEQESIITDGGLDHQNTEWDTLSNTTLSADCCSQIGGRIGLQQQLHDGDVSEASFVLVKRKLKVKKISIINTQRKSVPYNEVYLKWKVSLGQLPHPMGNQI
ncbi:unnamed protein product [Meloidogyne enterolobii]|uniref:Uncharacterized protein n=1 Tax=Meloidogyne enterolobii TaxID=390850 RepID=A0ACB1A6U5_MELEN